MHAIRYSLNKLCKISKFNLQLNSKDINQTKTIAGGIAVATPPRLNQMVKAIQQNNGTCEIVSEKEIIEWQLALANQEGLYIEPTSAAAFASIKKLIKSKVIQKGESVLIPSTGIGLKDTSPI